MSREPIVNAFGVKEILTAVVILAFLFARDLGVYIPEDTKLQVVLVVTVIGSAVAAWWARNRSTPSDAPRIVTGTTVTTTNAAGTTTGTTIATPDAP